MTITEILNKILDNANAGKAIADVGPGFALAFPLLMILSITGNISFIPADRLMEIDRNLKTAAERLESSKKVFCDLLNKQGDPCATAMSGAGSAEEGFAKARRRIALLGVDVEAYREQVRVASKAGKGVDPALKTAGEKNLRDYETLTAQKEVLDEASAEVQKYANQKADASSLEFNIAGLAQNISAIIAFSVVLGIVISQISRFVLVDFVFGRSTEVRNLLAAPAPPLLFLSKEDEEIVKGFFRYVEGAVNMVVPSILMGHTFPAYAAKKLGAEITGVETAAIWAAGWLAAILLTVSGYKTYVSFLKKRTQLAKAEAESVAAGKGSILTLRTKT